MASGFHNTSTHCERTGCRATAGITYYVKEKKKLCDDCAKDATTVSPTKKSELNLFCEKHDEPVRIHCKVHDVSVCSTCVLIEHIYHECERQDVGDAIKDYRRQLLDLQSTAKDKVIFWKSYGDRIRLCGDDANKHLQALRDVVDMVMDEAIKEVKDRVRLNAELISEKAATEVRRICKRRDVCLRQCYEDGDNQLKPIEGKRLELYSPITGIANMIQTELDALQKQAADLLEAIGVTTTKIESLLQDDEDLANGAREVIASLTARLGQTLEEGVVDGITRTVEGMRFIKGVGDKRYNGRIGGYNGQWELAETIMIPDEITDPRIVGSIDDSGIVITDRTLPNRHTYVLDLTKKTTQKVVNGNSTSFITSCTTLKDDTIVCGMWDYWCPRDKLEDCVRLYSRQWKLIKNITIPRNTEETSPWVHVAVDRDRMILAAERRQSSINVINPADGKIVETLKCEGEVIMSGVLSSGDIIARSVSPSNNLLILDRAGNLKEVTLAGEVHDCIIDPLTDDLYPVYWDADRKVFVVDFLSGNGEFKAKNVLDCRPTPIEENCCYFGSVMTSPGRLITCNGRDCLVYHTIPCLKTKTEM